MSVHPQELDLSDVRFTPAPQCDARRGLLGFVSFQIGRLRIDGVTIRRTTNGRLALSFPAHRDRRGWDHAYVRPLDDTTRREIERQVLSAILIPGHDQPDNLQ